MPRWKHKVINLNRAIAVGKVLAGDAAARVWLFNKYGKWVEFPGAPTGTASDAVFFTVFYLSYDCIWIGGRNGASQTNLPMLYYYDGNEWINLSSELSSLSSDLDDIKAIHGISKDCIYIAGNANSPGGDYGRLFKWNGSELSLEDSVSHGYYGVCVTPDGTIYVCGGYSIRFNTAEGEYFQDISVLDSPYNYGNITFYDINCYSNTEIVTQSGGRYYKFNGLIWTNSDFTYGSVARYFDGNSYDDIWGVHGGACNVEYFNGTSPVIYTSSDVPWSTTDIYNSSMILHNDAWFCGAYNSTWGTAVLSHWDGNSFSDWNDYDVGDMGAYEIHDVEHMIDL